MAISMVVAGNIIDGAYIYTVYPYISAVAVRIAIGVITPNGGKCGSSRKIAKVAAAVRSNLHLVV